MSLAAVVTEIFTDLETLVTGVTTEFGARAQPFHDAPPRAVWVPTGGPIAAPRPSGVAGQRNLYTRRVASTVYLWAADTDALEALLAAFLTAFSHACHGTGRPGAEQWVTDLGATSLGEALAIEVTVDVPVAELTTTIPIETVAFDTTTQDSEDGALQAGEPE